MKQFLRMVFYMLLFMPCIYFNAHSQTISDIITQRFQFLNHHDLQQLGSLYADSAVLESPNFNETKKGPAAVKEVYERYFTTSPDLSYKVTRILVGDTFAVVTFTSTGTMEHLESSVPEYMKNK